MTWLASLPMYEAAPRLRHGYRDLLATLLAQARVDAPVEQVPAAAMPPRWLDFWTRHDLLLSQTCGYPYVTALRGRATLLATPCFDVPGCGGAHHASDYSSVLVTRAGSGIATLADARGRIAAASERHSHSGMNALRHAVAPLSRAGRFFSAVLWSGSHAASARLVRDGQADIAALDCVTFYYLQAEDPETVAGLEVLGFTASAPGLPLIAGPAVPQDVVARLRGALLAPADELSAAMAALRIVGFEHRPDGDYGRIIEMESAAVSKGYPELN